MRKLIVNADDFGLSLGVTQGIMHAHEHGIVTSTSLMVRYPAAVQAATYALAHPDLSVGLHLDIAEWTRRDGHWALRYEVVPASDPEALASEIARQLERFRVLVGREPSHLDSHQHLHTRDPLRSILLELAHKLDVPLRSCTPKVQYCGSFYGQAEDGSGLPLNKAMLIEILRTLPEGIVELGCHPGWVEKLESDYKDERVQELHVLSDPSLRNHLSTLCIDLISFKGVKD